MLSLRELQQRFGAALFAGHSGALAEVIVAEGIEPEARIDIYRNNYRLGFRKALALSFPVIERLVGADCFSGLAHDYQTVHPSRSGDLHPIGGAFAGFLAGRFCDGEFMYLADVAALEWACQEIAVAAACVPMSVDDLRSVDPTDYEALALALHPAARLLSSPYPVVRIWMSNQNGATPEVIALDAGADRVLVRDTGDGLEFLRLRAGEFALAAAVAAGLALGPAAERALAAGDQSFDLALALHRLLVAGALVPRATLHGE